MGDINVNFAPLKNTQTLAKHVLVFLVKSVVNPLSYSFATFAIDGITAYQIMSIFWQAVKYLEKNNLKVIAATGDGASQDRKFFRMHKHLLSDSDTEILYQTKNIYTKEIRFIYFFSDVPHLMKTIRNCFSILGLEEGQGTCGNTFFFFYGHIIAHIYHEDLESGLKLVNKLTSDHIT